MTATAAGSADRFDPAASVMPAAPAASPEGANGGRNGTVVTFYSYKGGTGRTMSLANVAWILAANGKRVLAVDWDLDSPGLHRFFHPFLPPSVLAS